MKKLLGFASVIAFNIILAALVFLLCNVVCSLDVHVVEKIALVATYSSLFLGVVVLEVVKDNNLWRLFLKMVSNFKFSA